MTESSLADQIHAEAIRYQEAMKKIRAKVDEYAYATGNAKLVLTGDYQPIREWLREGCDVDKDILPVMAHLMQKKRDIYSYKWFTKAILSGRDARLAAEAADAQKKPEDIHARAKKLAAMRRLSPGNFTRFAAELEAYEQQHGKVD